MLVSSDLLHSVARSHAGMDVQSIVHPAGASMPIGELVPRESQTQHSASADEMVVYNTTQVTNCVSCIMLSIELVFIRRACAMWLSCASKHMVPYGRTQRCARFPK